QSLGEEKRGMVAAAIAKAEQDLRAGSHVAPATYSGGGAGGNSSSADPMAGLGDALAALTQGLNGKSKDGAPLGPKSEQFGSHAAANSIVGTEQDRSMSLFTRVSRRYAASRDRIFSLQYASPQNRALTR
ncbi:hypothetical protein EBZ37_13310, partial [bacterium]|nr:hypothetical protein [bacterium]